MFDSGEWGLAGLKDRLRQVRGARRLTQRQVAEHVGLKLGAAQAWEAGRNFPDLPSTMAIAELLRVSAVWLVFGEGKQAPSDDQLAAKHGIKLREREPVEIAEEHPAANVVGRRRAK